MKIKLHKIILIILLCLWCCFIFYMSSQKGEQSSLLSQQISHQINNKIPHLQNYTISVFNKYIDLGHNQINIIFEKLVRKSAHMFEYFVLTLIILFVFDFKKYRYVFALFFAGAVACLDEFYQLFVPGRSGQITDVFIDGIGIVAAIIFIYSTFFILKIIKKYVKVY